ncbi:MAG TPA: hypothetical protein VKE42_08850 [Candidatus Cybelea sp.]|nr:hypothetical protein [Candidatus Cybelea sp.]
MCRLLALGLFTLLALAVKPSPSPSASPLPTPRVTVTVSDFAFDAVEDYLSRPADAGQPLDVVATRYPQVVLSWAHRFNKNVLAVGGYGRFAAMGTWAIAPVDGIYGLGFAGVEFATGPKTAFLVQARRYALVGVPSIPYGPPPTMRGSAVIVDQRIAL